jgi:hypothetical protein
MMMMMMMMMMIQSFLFRILSCGKPVSIAARSKASTVFDRSNIGIAGPTKCLKGSISKKENPTPEKGIRNNEKEEELWKY